MKPIVLALLLAGTGLTAFAAGEPKAAVLVDPQLLQLFTTPINQSFVMPTNFTTATVTTLYLAKPAALRVVVPSSADERMVHQPPGDKTFALKIIEPPVELEAVK